MRKIAIYGLTITKSQQAALVQLLSAFGGLNNSTTQVKMPLKITLKPHERLIVGGAAITNGSTKCDLVIDNKVPILRQKDIMSENDADSPCRRIYFVIQLMYVDEGNLITHHNTYWKLVQDLVKAAPSMLGLIDEISEHILSSRYYRALKLARKLIDYEQEAIDRV